MSIERSVFPRGQVLEVGRVVWLGALNSLRRRQGRGALVAFPLLFAFLLVELARFGSRATDGMRAVLARASPAKGLFYASVWLSVLAVAIVSLKYARVVPGRGARRMFDTPLFRALPVAPATRLVCELVAGSTFALGFVLLVWVPSVWGVVDAGRPRAVAVILTTVTAVAVNTATTLVAMALHSTVTRSLSGRGLDGARLLSAITGIGLIGLYSTFGPIGAGVARRLRVNPNVPRWAELVPLRAMVRWLNHPGDLYALVSMVASVALPSLVAALLLLRALRYPGDLSLDAPAEPAGTGRWEPRLSAWRMELRALVRQVPYLPLATPAFLMFFLVLAKGARGATGADLPLIVLMGLTAWATVVMGTALSGALSRRWRRVLWVMPSLGRDAQDAVRASAAAHTVIAVGVSVAVCSTLMAERFPGVPWLLRMVLGVAAAIAVGQWTQCAAVFLMIDPSPDRLTGLSVGALMGVLAASVPSAALIVLLSATPLATWAAMLGLLVLLAWSMERAAVGRLQWIRDPDGDTLAPLRTWPALRSFGLAMMAQLLVMQTGETVLSLSPAGMLVAGYLAFALVAIPTAWRGAEMHRVVREPPRWGRARAVLTGVAVGAANFAVAALYARWARDHLGASQAPLAAALASASRGWKVPLVVFAAALGPLAEELFFRGWLQRALPNDLGPRYARWAPVIAAAVFALMHAGESWAPALTAGLIAGALMERGGRIEASLAMHVTNNSLVMAAVLLA